MSFRWRVVGALGAVLAFTASCESDDGGDVFAAPRVNPVGAWELTQDVTRNTCGDLLNTPGEPSIRVRVHLKDHQLSVSRPGSRDTCNGLLTGELAAGRVVFERVFANYDIAGDGSCRGTLTVTADLGFGETEFGGNLAAAFVPRPGVCTRCERNVVWSAVRCDDCVSDCVPLADPGPGNDSSTNPYSVPPP